MLQSKHINHNQNNKIPQIIMIRYVICSLSKLEVIAALHNTNIIFVLFFGVMRGFTTVYTIGMQQTTTWQIINPNALAERKAAIRTECASMMLIRLQKWILFLSELTLGLLFNQVIHIPYKHPFNPIPFLSSFYYFTVILTDLDCCCCC